MVKQCLINSYEEHKISDTIRRAVATVGAGGAMALTDIGRPGDTISTRRADYAHPTGFSDLPSALRSNCLIKWCLIKYYITHSTVYYPQSCYSFFLIRSIDNFFKKIKSMTKSQPNFK